MLIERFEDLVAWQRARGVARRVWQLTQEDPLRHDRVLSEQLYRAAVSAMTNLAEGFDRGNPGDFHRFASIAKGSCGEAVSLLYLAVDVGLVTRTTFLSLTDDLNHVRRLCGGLCAASSRRRNELRESTRKRNRPE